MNRLIMKGKCSVKNGMAIFKKKMREFKYGLRTIQEFVEEDCDDPYLDTVPVSPDGGDFDLIEFDINDTDILLMKVNLFYLINFFFIACV